ncbi:MAG: DsbA family protein [Halobacterium sp.]
MGPKPGTAEGTIIAFEDPSCPSCRRFEAVVLPKLKRGLVDPGRVSFVYRNVHAVRDWAEYATLALETVYARDAAAFWELKSYYFQHQPDVTTQNVEARTREFLDASSLDAASVRREIESGTHRPALRTDVQAAETAGVQGTPTFFLFDAGADVGRILGPQPYSVFAKLLGVDDG